MSGEVLAAIIAAGPATIAIANGSGPSWHAFERASHRIPNRIDELDKRLKESEARLTAKLDEVLAAVKD